MVSMVMVAVPAAIMVVFLTELEGLKTHLSLEAGPIFALGSTIHAFKVSDLT